jgi:hypothetical protein
MGFDAAVQFAGPGAFDLQTSRAEHLRYLRRRISPRASVRHPKDFIFPYSSFVEGLMRQHAEPLPYTRFPCVAPGWDNSPRRQKDAYIFTDATPDRYGEWVAHACRTAPAVGGDSLVFINAWNEWAEGAHLEPGLIWGRQYLDAHRAARIRVESEPLEGSTKTA